MKQRNAKNVSSKTVKAAKLPMADKSKKMADVNGYKQVKAKKPKMK